MFLNLPKLQAIDESGDLIIWKVCDPFAFKSEIFYPGKLYIVPQDFESDGASVPRLIPFISAWYIGRAITAAVLHDFFYRSPRLRQVESREEADLIFLEAMLCTKVPESIAYQLYAGVKNFGWAHYKES